CSLLRSRPRLVPNDVGAQWLFLERFAACARRCPDAQRPSRNRGCGRPVGESGGYGSDTDLGAQLVAVRLEVLQAHAAGVEGLLQRGQRLEDGGLVLDRALLLRFRRLVRLGPAALELGLGLHLIGPLTVELRKRRFGSCHGNSTSSRPTRRRAGLVQRDALLATSGQEAGHPRRLQLESLAPDGN